MTSVAYAPPITRLEPSSDSLENIRAAVVELQEYVRTREPEHAGDALDKVVTWRDAVSAGLAKYSLGTFGQSGPGGGGSFEPPPPSGLSGWDDLTPPDQLENLVVTSMPTGFFVEFDAPIYGQGGGNAYSIIYQANYDGTPPLPTFSNAVEVGRITERGVILVIAAEPGTQGHFWAQPVSFAEDYNRVAPQATPTGGTNGVSATAGLIDGAQHVVALSIGTAQIGNLAVTDAKMVSLSAAKLTAGSIGVSEYIQSTGFVSGSAGWKISGNGNAEFNNIVARGAVYASSGLIGGASIGSTYVQSTNYTASTGWKLDNNTGTIYANDIVLQSGIATGGGTSNTTFSVNTWTALATVTRTDNALSYTASGAPSIISIDVYVELGRSATDYLSTSVDWVQTACDLNIDGVFKRASVDLRKVVPASVGRWAGVSLHLQWREVLSAGSHTFSVHTRVDFFDSAGASQSTDGQISVSTNAIVLENKL